MMVTNMTVTHDGDTNMTVTRGDTNITITPDGDTT